MGPHRAPRAPEGGGAPPMGPMGPQGPHEGRGRPPMGPMGPQGPQEGRRRPHGPYGAPRAPKFDEFSLFWRGAPKSESDPGFLGRKKSRDLANLDPPRAPEGLPHHFCQISRGQKLGIFDELWPIEIFPEKKRAKTSPAPNVDLNRGWTATGLDCHGAGLPRGCPAPGPDCPRAGLPRGWTATRCAGGGWAASGRRAPGAGRFAKSLKPLPPHPHTHTHTRKIAIPRCGRIGSSCKVSPRPTPCSACTWAHIGPKRALGPLHTM